MGDVVSRKVSRAGLWAMTQFLGATLYSQTYTLTAQAAPLPPGTYELTPQTAAVGFEVGNFLVMTVEGKFNEFTATVAIAEPFSASHVEAKIKTASIDTGNKDRDKHLRSDDFFAVETYPELTFISTQVSGSSEKFEIKGRLTIRGTTRDVVLTGHGGQAGDEFVAECEIDRTDFKLTYGSTIKDTIEITLKTHLPPRP